MIGVFEKEIEDRGGSFGNDVIGIQSPRNLEEGEDFSVSRQAKAVDFINLLISYEWSR